MKDKIKKNFFRIILTMIIAAGLFVAVLLVFKKPVDRETTATDDNTAEPGYYHNSSDVDLESSSGVIKEARGMPVFGNWQTFTTKDGLPSDHIYTIRIDGDRVLAGTHDGLAVYENNKWKSYTTKDGLAHNGVASIDVNELTGDVWIGTLGGLTKWSSGKFTSYNQFNSGLPNDLVYCVFCDGNDVWVATGGGAGHLDTRTGLWEIFTELNAPMHEPWTYGVSAGEGKVYIAAWGGGVIEYNYSTKQFRDYTDPDGFMEIDLQPDDGVVHDITTATSYSDSILWVSTYFGMSRYDGKNWKGYFNTDSGLASNFINFIRAEGRVVFICSDNGLSSTDGTTWVTYKKDDNSLNGKAIITTGDEKKEVSLSPSISHNYIIGVDAAEDVLWVATSKGVCRGELIR